MRNRTPFGERLVLARKHAGLNQVQLAKAIGVSQSTIAEAEKAGQGSSKTTQIASVCRVDAHWLATGEGSMLSPASQPEPTVTVERALQVLAASIEGISDAGDRVSACSMLATFIDNPRGNMDMVPLIAKRLAPNK